MGKTNKEINKMHIDRGKCYERNESRKTNLLAEMVEGLLYIGKLGKLGKVRSE